MKEIRLRKNDIEVLVGVKAYIETIPEELPNIPLLAKKFGINSDKLKKGFKHVYGVAPYRYVLQLRVDRAKVLLRETEFTVAEIAIELGYEYPENFSAWFKKETGMRPLQWRRRIGK